MNNIKWEDGAVCFAGGRQWGVESLKDVAEWLLIKQHDLQLSEIRTGDYISASELDTEQKYNDAVEAFELFGFEPYLNRDINKGEFITHAVGKSLGLIADSDGDLVLDYNESLDIKQRNRKITYTQLMAIGKLKRAMIESDDGVLLSYGEYAVEFKPSESPNSSDWSDEHYNHFYQLTKDDIERGEVKVDAYFVNRMWKINSWEDTGAGFHILKTFPRIANNKNSLKRELVALKKQVDILCKLHGVDDDTN